MIPKQVAANRMAGQGRGRGRGREERYSRAVSASIPGLSEANSSPSTGLGSVPFALVEIKSRDPDRSLQDYG